MDQFYKDASIFIDEYIRVFNGHVTKAYKSTAPIFAAFALGHVIRRGVSQMDAEQAARLDDHAARFVREAFEKGLVGSVGADETEAPHKPRVGEVRDV